MSSNNSGSNSKLMNLFHSSLTSFSYTGDDDQTDCGASSQRDQAPSIKTYPLRFGKPTRRSTANKNKKQSSPRCVSFDHNSIDAPPLPPTTSHHHQQQQRKQKQMSQEEELLADLFKTTSELEHFASKRKERKATTTSSSRRRTSSTNNKKKSGNTPPRVPSTSHGGGGKEQPREEQGEKVELMEQDRSSSGAWSTRLGFSSFSNLLLSPRSQSQSSSSNQEQPSQQSPTSAPSRYYYSNGNASRRKARRGRLRDGSGSNDPLRRRGAPDAKPKPPPNCHDIDMDGTNKTMDVSSTSACTGTTRHRTSPRDMDSSYNFCPDMDSSYVIETASDTAERLRKEAEYRANYYKPSFYYDSGDDDDDLILEPEDNMEDHTRRSEQDLRKMTIVFSAQAAASAAATNTANTGITNSRAA